MRKQFEFEYINITDNIKNLRRFLKLRDKRDEFLGARNIGAVGLPCLQIGEEIFLVTGENMLEETVDRFKE